MIFFVYENSFFPNLLETSFLLHFYHRRLESKWYSNFNLISDMNVEETSKKNFIMKLLTSKVRATLVITIAMQRKKTEATTSQLLKKSYKYLGQFLWMRSGFSTFEVRGLISNFSKMNSLGIRWYFKSFFIRKFLQEQ